MHLGVPRLAGSGPGAVALALAAAVALAAPLPAQAPPARVQASLRRVFGTGVHADTLRIDTTVVLRISSGGALVGFAEVRNVKGKDQPITYLVAVDPAGTLKDVDVLVYREPYGGEVAYEPWRKQFRGKGADAPLVVGKDVRNISGATISTHAVTAGVRQALDELALWRERKLLR